MSDFRRVVGGALVAMTIGLALAGCGGSKPQPAGETQKPAQQEPSGGTSQASKEPIKFGVITHISGRFAFLGESQQAAVKLAEDEINKKGGIAGRALKVIVYDDEADETKSVSVANRLLFEDKVDAVVGPVVTRAALVVTPLTDKAKIPHIELTADASTWEAAKAKYVFQTTPREEIEIATVVDFVKNTLGKAKVGVLYDKQPYGLNLYKHAQRFAKEMNITITGAEAAGNQDTDVMPQLLKLKESGAEVLCIFSGDPMASSAAKQMKQLGWNVPIIGSSAIAGPRFIQLAGDAAEGVYTTGVINYQSPPANQKPFIDAFTAKAGKAPDQFAAFAYDAIYLLKAAIEKAGGKTDGDSVASVIVGMPFSGVTSTGYRFTAEDHNGLGFRPVMLMSIVKDKNWVHAPKK